MGEKVARMTTTDPSRHSTHSNVRVLKSSSPEYTGIGKYNQKFMEVVIVGEKVGRPALAGNQSLKFKPPVQSN